jgi:hypothetical protein
MLSFLVRSFLINRLFRSGRRTRGRGGFFGPLPYYTRRTRGGSRVTVSGCCLPIPLMLVTALSLALRLLVRG